MIKETEYKLKKSKTIRLSDSAIKNINYMVNETKISESELLRSIIEKAIEEYRLKKAFVGIENGKESIASGARIAGLSYRDFYEKMIENNIKANFNEKAIGVSGKRLLSIVNKSEAKKNNSKMQRAGFEPAKH